MRLSIIKKIFLILIILNISLAYAQDNIDLLLRNNDYKGIIKQFSTKAKTDKEIYYLGYAYYNVSDTGNALRKFNLLAQQFKTSRYYDEALINAAIIYYKENNIQSFYNRAEQVLKFYKNPANLKKHLNILIKNIKASDYDKIVNLYLAGKPPLYNIISQVYEENNLSDSAILWQKKIISRSNNYFEYYRLALLNFKAGKEQEGVKIGFQTIKKFSDREFIYIQIAGLFIDYRKYNEAIEVYLQARKNLNKPLIFHNELINLYEALMMNDRLLEEVFDYYLLTVNDYSRNNLFEIAKKYNLANEMIAKIEKNISKIKDEKMFFLLFKLYYENNETAKYKNIFYKHLKNSANSILETSDYLTEKNDTGFLDELINNIYSDTATQLNKYYEYYSGQAMFNKNEYDKALSYLEIAINKITQKVKKQNIYLKLFEIYHTQKNLKKAEENLILAAKQLRNRDVYKKLAFFYLKNNMLEKAMGIFNQMKNIKIQNPDYCDFYILNINILKNSTDINKPIEEFIRKYSMSEFIESVIEYKKIVESDKDILNIILKWQYLEKPIIPETDKKIQAIISDDKKSFILRKKLCLLKGEYLEKQNKQQAIKFYIESEKKIKDYELLYKAALIYRKINNIEKEKEILQKILINYDDILNRSEIEKRIKEIEKNE